MNTYNILLRHNYVSVPTGSEGCSSEQIATVMMNLSYYGYALHMDAYKALLRFSSEELSTWWTSVEKELKSITGDDRKIGDFVVYKNFPAEVMEKSLAEYWIPQILMYWGFPNEFFTEAVKPRAGMKEQPRLKVLKRTKNDTLKGILDAYVASPARWKDHEFEDVRYLSEEFMSNVDFSKIVFKENLIALTSHFIKNGIKVRVNTATDVLRLAAGLSDADVSLLIKPKFKSFNKPMRRWLLAALDRCSNLAEDVARRPEMWKRLLSHLHPFDYAKSYKNVCKVTNDLYHGRLGTFNSKVEPLLLKKDNSVLELLKSRPGDFRRRLVHTLKLFGDKAVEAFTDPKVIDGLTNMQVVTLRTHLESINDRLYRVFPPKGNWNKLQVGEAGTIDKNQLKAISSVLGRELRKRLPEVRSLDKGTKLVKLPNNGEVGPYTRGTSFPIPKDVDFIRTASYWKAKRGGNVWFDNGWNFFDSDWKTIGSCCWNAVKFDSESYGAMFTNLRSKKKDKAAIVGAVFSGDPTNSKEMEGRAAQMIDLYPSKLREMGVRYAVWNVLCYSNIPFADADDVFAALQWGTDAQSGKLFEPSRCQLAFPLTGKQLTKYVCLLDLETNEMIYLDANLSGKVSSAASNGEILEKTLPAFMEYIKALPSVYDLFKESISDEGIHVLYSDKDVELKDTSAYVFRPENKENKFKPVDLNSLLA